MTPEGQKTDPHYYKSQFLIFFVEAWNLLHFTATKTEISDEIYLDFFWDQKYLFLTPKELKFVIFLKKLPNFILDYLFFNEI